MNPCSLRNAIHTETPAVYNMSVAPRTVISHRHAPQRFYGSGVCFALPKSVTDTSPAALLRLLAPDAHCAAGTEHEALRALLNAAAAKLDLPGAAPVVPASMAGDRNCRSLRKVLAVLTKSSDRVYLRDKEPNLAILARRRSVVLLLPPTWSPS